MTRNPPDWKPDHDHFDLPPSERAALRDEFGEDPIRMPARHQDCPEAEDTDSLGFALVLLGLCALALVWILSTLIGQRG